MSTLQEKILLGALLTLLALTVSASYYRYIVTLDFLVTYEIDCNPTEESCFVGCEDDECTTEYYFSEIEREAQWLQMMCGENITDCAIMNTCTESENHCVLTTCNAQVTSNNCSEQIL